MPAALATAGFFYPLVMTQLWVSWWTSGRPESEQGIFPLALLLGTATPLAQYAGAWSQWPVRVSSQHRRRWQFGIRQLLVATGWIAAMLSLLKVAGLLTSFHLTTLAAWFLFQLVTLQGTFLFCRWRARQRRSGEGGEMRG